MGAAVLRDGSPSGALRRRVESALALGGNLATSFYLVTGGKGRFGPPESVVMSSLLQAAGVARDHILTDSVSHDTLSSIMRCVAMLRCRHSVDSVIVCTDRYHLLRCRWLFWLSGVSTRKHPMLSGLRANGMLRWTYYYIREFLAIPWDTALLISRRMLQRDPFGP